ncbi:MAG: NUDIX hydrolase [Solobacterium sp.]|nr:NUDIX hydrolase [Solobacterium sp.]
MEKPKLKQTDTLFTSRYVNVYECSYEEGQKYYIASRRKKEDLSAKRNEKGLPDAISCFVILEGKENRLLLFHEYRYPTGQYILSIPSGLIDEKDKATDNPIISAVCRELKEETGIELTEEDEVKLINPLVFCSPGFTDESTALTAVHVRSRWNEELSQDGAEGTEIFDGFDLVTKEEARMILKNGCDSEGNAYPLVTWAAMMYFLLEG